MAADWSNFIATNFNTGYDETNSEKRYVLNGYASHWVPCIVLPVKLNR